jgi:DNA repair exonuclease SbcCD ATPase subunit
MYHVEVLAPLVVALITAGSAAVVVDASEAVRKLLRRVVPSKADVSHAEAGSAEAPDSLVETILMFKRGELSLEERLAELTDLMSRSSTLVEQVSAELEARAATVERLKDEAKQAEELASLNREQAEAIRRLMDAELAAKLTENSAAIRKDVRKDAIRIGVGSFVAGGGLTLLITLLVH